jgi:hypothetical protein
MNKDLTYLKQLTTELGKEIDRVAAELGEEIKRLEQAPKPWPQDGDAVYVLSAGGYITLWTANGYNVRSLKNVIAQGNGFRLRAEAEAEWHYRDVAYKLSQQEGARKFVENIENWCILFNTEKEIRTEYRKLNTEGRLSIYFNTEQQVLAAIAAVGEHEIIRAIRWKELGETS